MVGESTGEEDPTQDFAANKRKVSTEPVLPMELRNAAITFSGGGFRATLFHLGVLLVLIKNRIINNQSVVVGVSGGAVLAAHWATNKRAFEHAVGALGKNTELRDVVERLLKLIRSDLRNRVFRRGTLYWSLLISSLFSAGCVVWAYWTNNLHIGWNNPTYCLVAAVLSALAWIVGASTGQIQASFTDILERQYESLLFKNKTLRDLGESVFLTGTSLTNGNLFVAGNSRIALYDYSELLTQLNIEADISLARMVCASSAFPPAFTPLAISFTGASADPKHYLTDGGVFDNLGIRTLRHTQANPARPEDLQIPPNARQLFAIVSDAGRPMQDRTDQAGWGLLSRNVRASDLTMYRLAELDLPSAADALRFSINDQQVAAKLGAASQTRNKNIAKIRTDLNRFSTPEIVCIVDQGAKTAHQGLRARYPKHQWNDVSDSELIDILRMSKTLSTYHAEFDRAIAKVHTRKRFARLRGIATAFRDHFIGWDVVCLGWLIPLFALISVGAYVRSSTSNLTSIAIELTETIDEGIEVNLSQIRVQPLDLELTFIDPRSDKILWTLKSSLSAVDPSGTLKTEVTKGRLGDRSYERLKCKLCLLAGGQVLEERWLILPVIIK